MLQNYHNTKKDVVSLLKQMISKGISVFMEDDKLKLKIANNQQLDTEFIEVLKTKKNDIISFLQNEAHEFTKVNKEPSVSIMKRQNNDDNLPLSFSQQSLWALDYLSGSIEYHMPAVFRFKGTFNLKTLEMAFNSMINRHEILRTVYVEKDGTVSQKILEKNNWSFDGEDQPEQIVEEKINEYIKEMLSIPFDLTSDHMLRAKVCKLSENEHVLFLVIHHIAADGWSLPIILNELVEVYRSISNNVESSLIDLPIQYADYALWEKSYLSEDVIEDKINYWENKLSNVAPINLPIDYPRQAVRSVKGATLNFTIEQSLRDQLEELARKENVTFFMLLLTLFKVLIHKYNNQDDICIGTPIANRNQVEIESLIGFFVNTLALRSDLGGNPTLKELLAQVKSTTLAAYTNQDVPFEKIVKKIEKSRDTSRTPVFQVLFKMQDELKASRINLGEVDLFVEPFETNTSKFDLTFNISKTTEELEVEIQYCTDLFLPERIERMSSHFLNLLNAAVKNPSERIGNYKIITPTEEQQLLFTFNNTEVNYPDNITANVIFEQQVEKTPDNIALVCNGHRLTYREVDQRANQLANYLQQKGIKEESLILVCLDRSLEIFISIFGILKAGAAFVPLDPLYPEERLKYLIEDVDAKLIITSQKYQSTFANVEGLELVLLDDESQEIVKQSTIKPVINIRPQNLAYIIYTSGSTGKPKGVMIEHANLANYIQWVSKSYSKEIFSSAILLSNYTFDGVYTSIYGTLMTGGTLHIATSDLMKDGLSLLKYFVEEKLSVLKITPSHLNVLLNLDESEAYFSKLDTIKLTIMGGEPINTSDVQKLHQLNKKMLFMNHYGPTETTIGSSIFKIDNSNIETFLNQPVIGSGINNTQIYIVDANQNLVPIGVEGEICIAGKGVGRGYLNKKELTKEKFVTNPFRQGERMYKTGDIGKWLPNGTIECLGRNDNQVKIRGYRIELGEIESILQQSPFVNQCVLDTIEDKNGNNRIVAHVVANGPFEKTKIQNYLKHRLPVFMLPSFIVESDSLPLTSRGKVDKKSLKISENFISSNSPYKASSNEEEKALLDIWKDLLDVEKIGVQDNFFELGGDSIIAIRFSSRLNRIGYKLDARMIFEFPTIEQLAQKIREKKDITENTTTYFSKFLPTNKENSLRLLSEKSDNIPLFCVPGTGGEVASFYHLGNVLGSDIRLYAFQAYGLDGGSETLKSVEEIATVYIKEMQEIDPHGPYYLGGYCFGSKVIYEMALQLQRNGFEVARLIIFDVPAPHRNIPSAPSTEIEEYLIGIGDYIMTHLQLPYKLKLSDFKYKTKNKKIQLLIDYLSSNGIDLAPEQIEGFVDVGSANAEANCAYAPTIENKLDIPITLIKAADTPFDLFDRDTLLMNGYGWEEVSSAAIEIHIVDGNHDSFLQTPNVGNLAEYLIGKMKNNWLNTTLVNSEKV